MNILQIDDSKAFCQLYRDFFTTRGYEFESTTDGKVGLELAIKNNYDVILLDMLMPKYGGWQFLEDLKKRKPSELKKIMIISMMEFNDNENEQLKEFGIHSVQKKSRKTLTILVNSIHDMEHPVQNKNENKETKIKKIIEPTVEVGQIKHKIKMKQNGKNKINL